MAVRVPKQQVELSKRTLTLLAGKCNGPAQLNFSQVSVASIDWHVGERGWQGKEARNGGEERGHGGEGWTLTSGKDLISSQGDDSTVHDDPGPHP